MLYVKHTLTYAQQSETLVFKTGSLTATARNQASLPLINALRLAISGTANLIPEVFKICHYKLCSFTQLCTALVDTAIC